MPFDRLYCRASFEVFDRAIEMNAVTEKHREEFQRLGFTLVENVLPEKQLIELRDNLSQLWKRAKRKEISTVRVYEDFPHFLGGVNIAGIEDPFFHAPILADWISLSGIDRHIRDLTNWSGAELELARIHTNDRFKYQGFWHRDTAIKNKDCSAIGILYFYDEEGFRIAPSTSKYSSATLPLGDELQRDHFCGPLEDEHVVAAPAGSIFFMKSYLLHRGYNNKRRLHLHMRFIESPAYDVKSWARYRNSVVPYNFAASSSLKRARTLISYCLPRKQRSSLFQA
jgi:hypothetical protein